MAASSDIVLRADGLAKTFRLGLFRKRVEAVREATFDVHRGEIFGYVGPNGSGKTTTLKMLMGLVFPTRGHAEVLGRPVPNRDAKRKLGYLPETPYFYEYLAAEELLDLVGALFDVPRRERRARADRLITRVGLDHARGRPLRKFSKGMLQRIGIAQALMGDPELVVLDEPMTGLDPAGIRGLEEILIRFRERGGGILLTTHDLAHVAPVATRVAFLQGGRVVGEEPVAGLSAEEMERRYLDVFPRGGVPRSGHPGGRLPDDGPAGGAP